MSLISYIKDPFSSKRNPCMKQYKEALAHTDVGKLCQEVEKFFYVKKWKSCVPEREGVCDHLGENQGCVHTLILEETLEWCVEGPRDPNGPCEGARIGWDRRGSDISPVPSNTLSIFPF